MPRRIPRLIDPQVLTELSQITPDIRREIFRYAARRVQLVAAAGCPVASNEPDILVADAIADTLTGVVSWDKRYHLSFHLCSVMRTRTWNQIARAKRHLHVPIEVAVDQEELGAIQHADGRHAPPRPDSRLAIVHTTHELYRTLRRGATRDAALLAILDAYALGFVKPRDVMRITKMTRGAFLNARRRLNRALVHMPTRLRRAAQDLIQNSRE